MMGETNTYRYLKWTAVALALGTILVFLYNGVFVRSADPYLAEYDRASRDFKDRNYESALKHFELALESNPEAEGALRGKADSLSLLGQHHEALEIYNALIKLNPDEGGYYANRGIINDRMGRYRRAIADYKRAYGIDPELDDGPGWISRFLRNQQDKPPTILARAQYLEYQLSLPAEDRKLSDPELDNQQRPHKR